MIIMYSGSFSCELAEIKKDKFFANAPVNYDLVQPEEGRRCHKDDLYWSHLIEAWDHVLPDVYGKYPQETEPYLWRLLRRRTHGNHVVIE